ncbi:MAG: 4Fe-4S ferredoxin [Pseudodesulfovibrio sp.]
MKARPYSAWISRVYIFAMAALAFTGLLQMPLAKRYYLTEVPGMAWTGDFFIVHKLHYIFAALLLFVIGVVVVNWFLEWRDKLTLTPLGMARVGIVAGLVISGGLRVYRGLPDVTLDPIFVLAVEWVHLVLFMIMGGVALAALIKKCSAFAQTR